MANNRLKQKRGAYYTLSTIARRVWRMKGKLLIYLFGVAFTVFAQLLVYYLNPTNHTTLEAVVQNTPVLLFNVIVFIAAIGFLLLVWHFVKTEDTNEKAEQITRDMKLAQSLKDTITNNNEILVNALQASFKTAFKEALREDREEVERQHESLKKPPIEEGNEHENRE
jgi:hypothetical protein